MGIFGFLIKMSCRFIISELEQKKKAAWKFVISELEQERRDVEGVKNGTFPFFWVGLSSFVSFLAGRLAATRLPFRPSPSTSPPSPSPPPPPPGDFRPVQLHLHYHATTSGPSYGSEQPPPPPPRRRRRTRVRRPLPNILGMGPVRPRGRQVSPFMDHVGVGVDRNHGDMQVLTQETLDFLNLDGGRTVLATTWCTASPWYRAGHISISHNGMVIAIPISARALWPVNSSKRRSSFPNSDGHGDFNFFASESEVAQHVCTEMKWTMEEESFALISDL